MEPKLNFTTILHEARRKLGLSMNEYAVAELIYNLSNNPTSQYPNWCYASKKKLGAYLDLSEQSVHTILNKLVDLGLVEKHPETRHLRTTSKWYDSVILSKDTPALEEAQDTLATLKKLEPEAKESLVGEAQESLAPIYDKDNKDKDINKITPLTPQRGDDEEKAGEKKIDIFIKCFNEKFKSDCRSTPGRERKLKLRLERYSFEEILGAVDTLASSPFHQGNNARGWKADPDFLLRSDEQIDKWRKQNTAKNDDSGELVLEPLEKSYPRLEDITDDVVLDIAQELNVPIGFVRSRLKDMINWHRAKPFTNYFDDYRCGLIDWINKDSLKIKLQNVRSAQTISINPNSFQ